MGDAGDVVDDGGGFRLGDGVGELHLIQPEVERVGRDPYKRKGVPARRPHPQTPKNTLLLLEALLIAQSADRINDEHGLCFWPPPGDVRCVGPSSTRHLAA